MISVHRSGRGRNPGETRAFGTLRMSAVDEHIAGRELDDQRHQEAAGQSDDLAALVAEAARGDGQAWSELIERYARRVYALAKSRLRDPDEAEEVSQAVFASVFQHVSTGRYTERGQFEPWLFRIAMNRIRDQIRRNTRRVRIESHTDRVISVPSEVADESHDLGKLRSAIDSLNDSDQEIIGLRHQAGMEFKAIAELLNEPVGTLLARHHRAMHKLRKLLGVDAQAGVSHE